MPTAALPRVGTLGDAPANAVEVVVAEDGAPYLGGARVEAERFEAALRATVGAPAAGTADVERDVIVRVAADAPWRAVARVRRACRAVGAWRVHVAVVGEGDGAEGAMALFLPVEDSRVVYPYDPMDEPPAVPVELWPNDVDAPEGVVFATFRGTVAAAPGAPVRVSSPDNVAVVKVLRTVDLAVRAGAPQVLHAEREYTATGEGGFSRRDRRCRSVSGRAGWTGIAAGGPVPGCSPCRTGGAGCAGGGRDGRSAPRAGRASSRPPFVHAEAEERVGDEPRRDGVAVARTSSKP